MATWKPASAARVATVPITSSASMPGTRSSARPITCRPRRVGAGLTGALARPPPAAHARTGQSCDRGEAGDDMVAPDADPRQRGESLARRAAAPARCSISLATTGPSTSGSWAMYQPYTGPSRCTGGAPAAPRARAAPPAPAPAALAAAGPCSRNTVRACARERVGRPAGQPQRCKRRRRGTRPRVQAEQSPLLTEGSGCLPHADVQRTRPVLCQRSRQGLRRPWPSVLPAACLADGRSQGLDTRHGA